MIALALGAALLGMTSTSDARLAPRARQGDLLDRAVASWAKVKTARASFEQTITNPLTGRTLTASGEYQQERPGKLAVLLLIPRTTALSQTASSCGSTCRAVRQTR